MDWQSATIGACLGALIGVITGSIFIYTLRSLSQAAVWSDGVKIVTEMLSIPTFWFGGPWVATQPLKSLSWPVALPWYLVLLLVLFLVVALVPLARFVGRVAGQI